MIACPECGAAHYPGTLFCDNCGAGVHPAARAHLAAQSPAEPMIRRSDPADEPPRPVARQRVETVAPAVAAPPLHVHIPHRGADVELRAAVIHIGRADPDATFAPDLDLTAHDGLDRGVSRRHATIQWAEGGYVLIDQHSSNGTWLEGVRLVAGYAYQIPPKATARFGDLVVHLAIGD